MNIKPICRLLIAAFSFILMENKAIAQAGPDLRAAQKWLDGNTWKNGLQLNVDPHVDLEQFHNQYNRNKAAWDKAFKFLRTTNLDTLSVGKHPIDGENVYASVTEAASKEMEKGSWESHKKYIDLQYVIKGKEQIGVCGIKQATVIKPYDNAKDVANYTAKGDFRIAAPGTFFLFFPDDVHKPNIKVEGFDIVKKIVIKIKALSTERQVYQ